MLLYKYIYPKAQHLAYYVALIDGTALRHTAIQLATFHIIFRVAGKKHLYILVLLWLYAFLFFLFFYLMIAGSCFSLFISYPWSSWHLHAMFKDGTHPFKGPEPAAHLANSPMPQHPARLQMVAWVVHLSRVQAFFLFLPAICCPYKACG